MSYTHAMSVARPRIEPLNGFTRETRIIFVEIGLGKLEVHRAISGLSHSTRVEERLFNLGNARRMLYKRRRTRTSKLAVLKD